MMQSFFRYDKSVLVVGDIMIDRYFEGEASRISPESPVPILHVRKQFMRPGGGANVALNIATLGMTVGLMGFVGNDTDANILKDYLQKAKVDCNFIVSETACTIVKLRALAMRQQMLRMDFEDGFWNCQKAPLLTRFKEAINAYDVIVFSDYAKGTLSHVDDMIRIARQAGKFILVDPKGPDFARYAGADIITPNMKEFIEAVGGADCEKEIEQKAAHLRTACDIRHILLTRGEAGMTLLSSDGAAHSIAANAQEVFDVTGAGDTVIATMAAAIASEIPMKAAMQLANLAAGIVVSRKGTSSVTEQDIASRLVQENTAAVSHDPFAMIEAAKATGATIVMTNGCFDILHAGHVSYLEQARKLGDHLVVAVNSDASVKRLKGVGRPVHTLEHRMAVLKSLRCVSWVVAFDGSIGADSQHNDTPADCIRRVSPDILVKGGDYREHEVAGAEHVSASGGKVVILPYVEGLSTTRIIDSTAK